MLIISCADQLSNNPTSKKVSLTLAVTWHKRTFSPLKDIKCPSVSQEILWVRPHVFNAGLYIKKVNQLLLGIERKANVQRTLGSLLSPVTKTQSSSICKFNFAHSSDPETQCDRKWTHFPYSSSHHPASGPPCFPKL